jgi:hypothetical protein
MDPKCACDARECIRRRYPQPLLDDDDLDEDRRDERCGCACHREYEEDEADEREAWGL